MASKHPRANKGNSSARGVSRHSMQGAAKMAHEMSSDHERRGTQQRLLQRPRVAVRGLPSRTQFHNMAAAGWLVACFRGGSLVLTLTSMFFYIKADQAMLSDADQRMWVTFCASGVVLLAESLLLNLALRHHAEQEQFSIGLILVECLLASITMGMALSALLVDFAATPVRYQLATDVMACGCGALTAASAIGLVFFLRSRLAQAPQQAQG